MQVFGQYAISSNPPEVRQGGRLVRLSPKQFGALALLVKAQGRTIRKDTFFRRVWLGSMVEESNLSQTVFLIRRALGKLPDGTDYIETIPGQGYRLAAGALPASRQAKSGLDAPSQVEASRLTNPANESHFRLLLDSIEDYAIYLLDPTGRVLTWNRGAESNKGYKSDEVLGQHYSLFFVPEDVESRVPDRELAIAATNGRCAEKVGRCARAASGSGPVSRSPRYVAKAENCSATPRSFATSATANVMRTLCFVWRQGCGGSATGYARWPIAVWMRFIFAKRSAIARAISRTLFYLLERQCGEYG